MASLRERERGSTKKSSFGGCKSLEQQQQHSSCDYYCANKATLVVRVMPHQLRNLVVVGSSFLPARSLACNLQAARPLRNATMIEYNAFGRISLFELPVRLRRRRHFG